MIQVGLAGWGDHEELYGAGVPARDKLKAYSRYFRIVEVDSSFYAVHKPELMERWAAETPEGFSFIVKAYQGMTGHLRGGHAFEDDVAMYRAFIQSIEPLRQAGKLKAVLFQYPPWFRCDRTNVALLRAAKERMDGIPAALEFRHQSWFEGGMREKTLAFMKRAGWAHSICDEPQVLPGSVPVVPEVTDDELTVVRFHGRNAAGWNAASAPNWREVRYLYRYSADELAEWAERLRRLEDQTKEIYVIFNNNSGGDAAANALELMALLGQETKPAAPIQLDLFDLP
ncbi:DUF72 domain-containing protein [Paenibacillus humicola]|uniref:DUF72 domain-containing protein n=1 Tax=Paenibacillus humicola TaxID=3110540 RepID=UPI00237BDE86|nr:DUF72 domain-containing protein [Paenibacillus humicola]